MHLTVNFSALCLQDVATATSYFQAVTRITDHSAQRVRDTALLVLFVRGSSLLGCVNRA